MVTRVKLESTVLYIMPILAETLEVCGSICQEKKMVEIRFCIKAQCFDKLYSVPITDSHFRYTYLFIYLLCRVQCTLSFSDVNKLAFSA